MMFPKGQSRAWKRKGSTLPNVPESDLQAFADDYLATTRADQLRIPNWMYAWVKRSAPKAFAVQFMERFTGYPDNTIWEPVGDCYSICLSMEIKRARGQLSGNRQKALAKKRNYQIPRSPGQIEALLVKFRADAEMLNAILNKYGGIAGLKKALDA